MADPTNQKSDPLKRFTATSAIILAFIVALEIVIMISPFAAFFYAAFNPFLLSLNQSVATRWLTAFFLPHMIVPPNEVLTIIRILGSILFVGGMLVFFVCAAQVYLGKLFKKGTAVKGLYAFIRHPQYLALALAALGPAIMWPRMLTLVLFGVLLLLYYILAASEERRMTSRYGEAYSTYKNRTGRFLPLTVEKIFTRNSQRPGSLRVVTIFVILFAVILGKGFFLRWYTVESLPLQSIGGADVSISSADTVIAAELIPAVLADSAVVSRMASRGKHPGHRLLAYFIPLDYVMQGMIANTGEDWKLFEQHKTIGMITEYILHPFGHLTGGHAHHAAMATMQHGPEMYALPAMQRRVIFLDIATNDNSPMTSPQDDFAINARRTPLFFVDVHLHTAEILQVRDLPAGSSWGTVPTPMF
jgi:protein-S-isoprenylcysteine O-methyltransferase Ste14